MFIRLFVSLYAWVRERQRERGGKRGLACRGKARISPSSRQVIVAVADTTMSGDKWLAAVTAGP